MKRKNFKEALSEAITELIITAVFFAIGAFILSLLNVKDYDLDTSVLVGIIAFALITALLVVCIKFVKSRKLKKQKTIPKQ